GKAVLDRAGAAGARDEDAPQRRLGPRRERRRGREVAALERTEPDLAGAEAPVEGDLAALLAADEVAHGQVLDAHAGRRDHDAVAARSPRAEVLPARLRVAGLGRSLSGAVDDHARARQSTQVNVRRSDADAVTASRALVVVARPDEDPVARLRRVDGGLDRGVGALLALPAADEQRSTPGSGRRSQLHRVLPRQHPGRRRPET